MRYLAGGHEGREFLEQPVWIKVLLVIAFLLVSLQHLHDGDEGAENSGDDDPAARHVGSSATVSIRIL